MLPDSAVAALARGEASSSLPPFVRDLGVPRWREEWLLRYGWNRAGDIPPCLDAPATSVRKVEIHDVYDLKQWWWKGTDGIRETTWPSVYNRSRLPGRSDYFILPDWNCYSLSGRSVMLNLPDESWNHVEISGAAGGTASLLSCNPETARNMAAPLFTRPFGQERTFHRLSEPRRGGKIRFDNLIPETPFGEFQVYHVSPGAEPPGKITLAYTLTGKAEADNPSLAELQSYIRGRYLPDERQVMVALPPGAPRTPKQSAAESFLPVVHILVPFEFRTVRHYGGNYARYTYTWENLNGGLDGIALDIPPLAVKPLQGGYFPLNIRVMDPLWPDRVLFDFTCSVRPGEARTLWMDTRDRVLPNGRSLYITIAGAGSDFGSGSLEGAQIRLIFKDRKEAAKEQEIDRFTQVRDNAGQMSEESPNIKKFRLYARFGEDMTDLFRVNPDHIPGRYYWARYNGEQGWPEFEQPKAPAGVPLWAFRQVENLKWVKKFILWWIDNRQIENGEFGGGLSDDSDMTQQWPGPALMGIEPEKLTGSVLRELEACYENGMFANGINAIMTDDLHATEEVIVCNTMSYSHIQISHSSTVL
jgi:hypothetical protein